MRPSAPSPPHRVQPTRTPMVSWGSCPETWPSNEGAGQEDKRPTGLRGHCDDSLNSVPPSASRRHGDHNSQGLFPPTLVSGHPEVLQGRPDPHLFLLSFLRIRDKVPHEMNAQRGAGWGLQPGSHGHHADVAEGTRWLIHLRPRWLRRRPLHPCIDCRDELHAQGGWEGHA